uniref:Chloride channel protein n=1 Tax=Panagrellus redivivus TaxID=6233 RepID=A0A7E4V6G0_PANRE
MVTLLCLFGLFIGQLRIVLAVRAINERYNRRYAVPFPPTYATAMKNVRTSVEQTRPIVPTAPVADA